MGVATLSANAPRQRLPATPRPRSPSSVPCVAQTPVGVPVVPRSERLKPLQPTCSRLLQARVAIMSKPLLERQPIPPRPRPCAKRRRLVPSTLRPPSNVTDALAPTPFLKGPVVVKQLIARGRMRPFVRAAPPPPYGVHRAALPSRIILTAPKFLRSKGCYAAESLSTGARPAPGSSAVFPETCKDSKTVQCSRLVAALARPKPIAKAIAKPSIAMPPLRGLRAATTVPLLIRRDGSECAPTTSSFVLIGSAL